MAVNKAYNVGKAFKAIEDELIASMMRNLEKHKEWETKEGFNWNAWQSEQLKLLEEYKLKNQEKFTKRFKGINKDIPELIKWSKEQGGADEEAKLLKAIGKKPKTSQGVENSFFKVNEGKLDALINATTNDIEKAEYAVLRKANDEYRQIIFNSQVYANTGAGTYQQAVDMATKDFLSAGIVCIQYSNGAMHTISDYADMAIKTANKRAYFIGEGEKRQEWGEHLVIVNKRTDACPKCASFAGQIFIDNVYSGGTKGDGHYPLLSEAMSAGLYHPRCKDTHSTYFEGISTPPSKWRKKELEELEENEKKEAKESYIQRMVDKYQRLAKYSQDKENKQKYLHKAKKWSHLLGDKSPIPQDTKITLQNGQKAIKKVAKLSPNAMGQKLNKKPWEMKIKPNESDLIDAFNYYKAEYAKQGIDKEIVNLQFKEWTQKLLDHYEAEALEVKNNTTLDKKQKVAKAMQLGKKKKPLINEIEALNKDVELWHVNEDIVLKNVSKSLIQVKHYDGIWYNKVVNTTEFETYGAKIQAKKDFFTQQIASPNVMDSKKIEFQKHLQELDEFEIEGAKYKAIEDDIKALEQKKKTLEQEIDDLRNPKKKSKKQKGGTTAGFSQAEKDNALWFTSHYDADKYFDPIGAKIDATRTNAEYKGFYDYTAGSGGFNRPLAGFRKPWSVGGTGWEQQFFVGVEKVWLDFEGKAKNIRNLTTYIEKSVYPDNIWLQSGQNFQTLEGLLNIPYGSLSNMTDAQLQNLVGSEFEIPQFISSAVRKGGGSIFNSKPMKFNIYAPKGSQMLYVRDGAFGKGEDEVILQRGGQYKITKIYWGKDNTDGGRMKIFVDIELHPEKGYHLFQQDPNEWKGSTKNYHNS